MLPLILTIIFGISGWILWLFSYLSGRKLRKQIEKEEILFSGKLDEIHTISGKLYLQIKDDNDKKLVEEIIEKTKSQLEWPQADDPDYYIQGSEDPLVQSFFHSPDQIAGRKRGQIVVDKITKIEKSLLSIIEENQNFSGSYHQISIAIHKFNNIKEKSDNYLKRLTEIYSTLG